MKRINIQNFYFVHSVIFSPLWTYQVHSNHISSPIKSSLVHFSIFWTIRSNLVDIGSMRSILVLLGPICFYSTHYVHIGPIRYILVHSVRPILSTHLVLFFFFFFFFLDKTFGPFLCTYIQGKNLFRLKTPILNLNLLIKIQISNL